MPGVFENDHAAVRSHDLHLLPQQCFVAFSPSIARTGMVSLVPESSAKSLAACWKDKICLIALVSPERLTHLSGCNQAS
jgi:hypothetical protein